MAETAAAVPPHDPATLVSTRVIAAGRHDDFADWLDRLGAALSDQGGRDGGPVLLEQAGGIAHLLIRFATRVELDAWLASDRYRALEAEADRFSIHRRVVRTGDRLRFTLPSDASAPRWKRALMTWATVFPLLLALSYLGQAAIGSWPRPLSLALSSAVMTGSLTWVILPWITRRLRVWSMQSRDGQVRSPDA